MLSQSWKPGVSDSWKSTKRWVWQYCTLPKPLSYCLNPKKELPVLTSPRQTEDDDDDYNKKYQTCWSSLGTLQSDTALTHPLHHFFPLFSLSTLSPAVRTSSPNHIGTKTCHIPLSPPPVRVGGLTPISCSFPLGKPISLAWQLFLPNAWDTR